MMILNLLQGRARPWFFVARTDAGAPLWFVPTQKLMALFDEETTLTKLEASCTLKKGEFTTSMFLVQM
jgi:hypothetical protein